jgi:hypothetical protein
MNQCRDRQELLQSYRRVRRATETLCKPLVIEDYVVQSMADVTPPKWHLGHTSWFFEQFLLGPFVSGYADFQVPPRISRSHEFDLEQSPASASP